MRHMKWWGWGDEAVSFEHRDKPAFAPFVKEAIDLDLDAAMVVTADPSRLLVPAPSLGEELRTGLLEILGEDRLVTDDLDRVVHAYGKSLRDLVRVRAGDLGRVPDAVCYPSCEAEVERLVRFGVENDVVLIAFGGGTNIAGSLEADRAEQRPVISVDLGLLDQVLEIDDASGLARVEAGVLGPEMEEQLNAAGFTLGHFPDSFNHSSLGGWIATRSSGMQSDKYGDIATITKALRVVTPSGILATRAVPASSTGPSVREMVLGSEGRLGIITEATLQVHRLPEKRRILGYFFPSWNRALEAMTEIAASDAAPSITRVSDPNETKMSLSTRKKGSRLDDALSSGVKAYLSRLKRFDLDKMCLSFIGFEGSTRHVKRQRHLVGAIAKNYGGVCVGSGPGALYDQKKFDTPYIRDYLLDRGALADVAETATAWSKLPLLYEKVNAAAATSFAELGVKGFVMCHLAHSYYSGACLYFTFAFKPAPGRDELAQYDVVKSALEQAFVDNGGTLSHHHAVGLEHARWLEADLSPVGAGMIAALFDALDPAQVMNPGKVVADRKGAGAKRT